jgi:hypothetical protein
MTWLIVGAVVVYLAIGAGFSRLWAWMNDYRSHSYYDDALQAEMLALFFLWAALVPLWLTVQLIRWAILPERMR